MMPGRRIALQLTPLLDLLLIVIFAQYFDVAVRERQERLALESSRDQVASELDLALRQLLQIRQQLAEMEDRAALAESRSLEADRFRAQRDLIGEVVAEMFQLPDATLNQLVQRRAAGGPGPSPNDIAQLKSRLGALAKAQPDQIVDHLLTFGEMRKRIDVWELHLRDTGLIELTVAGKTQQFRAEDPAAFATRLFDAYKTLPESKTMVLLLVSYGDSKFKPLKTLLDGLPLSLDRIRRDAGPRSRFEYAVLGYRPT